MLDFGKSDRYKHYLGIEPKNLDWYMNYLKDFMPNYKVMSYCINNLLFLHDTEFFTAGWLSFMQYKNEVIEYPIFKKFYELDDIGLAYIPLHNPSFLYVLQFLKSHSLILVFLSWQPWHTVWVLECYSVSCKFQFYVPDRQVP